MAFAQRTGGGARNGGGLVAGCKGALGLFGRALLSLATIAFLASGVLYLRLLQGPVTVPYLAELVVEQVNRASEEVEVDVGEVVISMRRDGTEPGFQFREVALRDKAGRLLFQVPKVAVRLALGDLIHGRVQPLQIRVLAPDAHLLRARSGALRFSMGGGSGVWISPDDVGGPVTEGGSEAAELVVFERFVRILSGDRDGPEVLSRLAAIDVEGAKLIFDDRLNGGRWSTEDARIRVRRDANGVRGEISVAVIGDGSRGSAVRMTAERLRGDERTLLTASFGQIRTSVMSGQLPVLGWLRVLEGTVEGRAEAWLDADGTVTSLGGVIIAEKGKLRGLGPTSNFDIAELAFEMEPQTDRLTFRRFHVAAPAVDARLSGVAEIRRDPSGEPTGLAAQLDVAALELRLPEMFSAPLSFDDGQVSLRSDLSRGRIDVADTRLSRGDLTFLVDGRAQEVEGAWITDLRAEARGMDIRDLLAHWPIVAATNARDWISTGIPKAQIDSFLAQMRFGDGEPQLALDFDYSKLSSVYIPGMPPITGARGRGHMTYHAFFLEMDQGEVTPPGGEPISLAGSSLDIEHFWGEVTPASVRLEAEGRTADILSLIDHPPLGLVSKLDLELGQVGGRARVSTTLDFPLISDLFVEDVSAVARARLTDLSMPFQLDGKTRRIRSAGLTLAADTEGMRLSGPITADGAALAMDWRENYGATPSRRTIGLRGRTTPVVIALAGSADPPIEGAVPFNLSITQTGAGTPGFKLEADLGPGRLAIPAIDWAKPKGKPGRLRAEGSMGESLSVSGFDLRAADLRAQGAVSFRKGGGIARARFDRLILPGLADVSGTVAIGTDGVPEIRLTGGSLDISRQLASEDRGREEVPPFRLSLNLDRLAVSSKIAFARTRGNFEQHSDGRRTATIDAAFRDGTPVAITMRTPPGEPVRLGLATTDAGAALAATGLYRGARGGRMALDAVLGDPGGPDISGSVRIEDVIVRSEATFRNVLRDGGLREAETEVAGDGIRFRKIWIPFVYEDGVIGLTDAIASSPVLALKVNGTLNEDSENMDLIGVLSPAYALTGALNRVPLLGTILSGGEGEGILAMTFTLKGAMRDPSLSVNPLSLLAPGFLRRIFSARGDGADEGFSKRLKGQNER